MEEVFPEHLLQAWDEWLAAPAPPAPAVKDSDAELPEDPRAANWISELPPTFQLNFNPEKPVCKFPVLLWLHQPPRVLAPGTPQGSPEGAGPRSDHQPQGVALGAPT